MRLTARENPHGRVREREVAPVSVRLKQGNPLRDGFGGLHYSATTLPPHVRASPIVSTADPRTRGCVRR